MHNLKKRGRNMQKTIDQISESQSEVEQTIAPVPEVAFQEKVLAEEPVLVTSDVTSDCEESPEIEKVVSDKEVSSEEKNLFEKMGLHPQILRALKKMEITTPTPIQTKALPLALAGKDVLGTAQTGTGKTFAFSIPLLTSLLNGTNKASLVIAPTRELAEQVIKAIEALIGHHPDIKTTLLIGGRAMFKQLKSLKRNPNVLVGTPGRIIDHFERGTIQTKDIGFIVLDEMDRMFDMGFGVQIENIMQQIPEKRQTLMFSATLAPNIERLAKNHMNEPERVSIEANKSVSENIKQESLFVSRHEKNEKLLSQLEEREGSVLIFVKTKVSADDLASDLRDNDFKAAAMHGNLRQNKRERVLQSFRGNKINILVATDVAARGLDIPHIQHVINYDLPQAPEDYIHRIGRTARAGATGNSLSLISPHDNRKWEDIQRYIDPANAKSRTSGYRQGGGQSSRGRQGSSFGGNRRSAGSLGGRGRSDSGSRGGFGSSDRGPRSFSSDRGSSGFSSDRGPRSFSSDRGSGGFSSDRKPRSFGDSSDQGSRSFSGDRGSRSFGGNSSDRSPRSDSRSQDGVSSFRKEGYKPSFNSDKKRSFNRDEFGSFTRDSERKPKKDYSSFGEDKSSSRENNFSS
jgi:superfamily II DNA/RNA helicase